MIACFDVDYQEDTANVGGIIFLNWEDETPFKTYEFVQENIAAYIPGEFYKRELPCLMGILDSITEPIDIIIVDSYVWLADDKKGLGAYLYEKLNKSIPVIGVAKNKFKRTDRAQEVFRGESQKPLYVTAAGIDPVLAAEFIKKMAGEFRFPTLLKAVDHLARKW